MIKRKGFTSSEDCSNKEEDKEKVEILRMLAGLRKKVLKLCGNSRPIKNK
jgi:hypothetical protein